MSENVDENGKTNGKLIIGAQNSLWETETLAKRELGKAVDTLTGLTWEFYKKSHNKTGRYLFDEERRKIIRKGIVEGLDEPTRNAVIMATSDVWWAIDGIKKSDFNMGRSRESNGKHADLSLILRDREHVERYRDLACKGGTDVHPALLEMLEEPSR